MCDRRRSSADRLRRRRIARSDGRRGAGVGAAHKRRLGGSGKAERRARQTMGQGLRGAVGLRRGRRLASTPPTTYRRSWADASGGEYRAFFRQRLGGPESHASRDPERPQEGSPTPGNRVATTLRSSDFGRLDCDRADWTDHPRWSRRCAATRRPYGTFTATMLIRHRSFSRRPTTIASSRKSCRSSCSDQRA